jgi:hypothetical protein
MTEEIDRREKSRKKKRLAIKASPNNCCFHFAKNYVIALRVLSTTTY